MTRKKDRLHELLDGEAPRGTLESLEEPEARELEIYKQTLELLEGREEPAPEGFGDRVYAALPEAPDSSFSDKIRGLWHDNIRARRARAFVALTSAAAALLLVVALVVFKQPVSPKYMSVTFEIHAPGARQVELVGNFTNWNRGEILLSGPDATGRFTAELKLEPGRYEYLFLVDGKTWITDPNAPIHRPDGFGHQNAILEL
jgi:hypothetical protein